MIRAIAKNIINQGRKDAQMCAKVRKKDLTPTCAPLPPLRTFATFESGAFSEQD
jgi:hypothetical protein